MAVNVLRAVIYKVYD